MSRFKSRIDIKEKTEMAGIKVTCWHCNQTLNVPTTMAGRRTACPACNGVITIPASEDAGLGKLDVAPNPENDISAGPPDRPAPPSVDKTGAKPPPLPRASRAEDTGADDTGAEESEVELLPWETPPEVLTKAEAYRESGQVKSTTCKVEEFLEGVLRGQVVASIKEKSKQEANLAEFHVYPDLVGVVHRPESPGCLMTLLDSFLPLQVAVLIVGLMSNLFGLAVLLVIALVILGVMMHFLGYVGTAVAVILLIGLGVGANYLVEYLSQKNLERIVARVRSDPKSPYAIKQMFKRAGWVRWRTGIGRGQSGAVMAERYWQKGDVVQLVRVDARGKLLKRNLILLVMDAPIPDDPGATRIAGVLVFRRLFCPTRRVYIVDVEGGPQAADAAADAASQVLGLPVRIGKFGLFALTLVQ